jgi:hypothetical protein
MTSIVALWNQSISYRAFFNTNSVKLIITLNASLIILITNFTEFRAVYNCLETWISHVFLKASIFLYKFIEF